MTRYLKQEGMIMDNSIKNLEAENKAHGDTEPHNAMTLRGCVPLLKLKAVQEGNQK